MHCLEGSVIAVLLHFASSDRVEVKQLDALTDLEALDFSPIASTTGQYFHQEVTISQV